MNNVKSLNYQVYYPFGQGFLLYFCHYSDNYSFVRHSRTGSPWMVESACQFLLRVLRQGLGPNNLTHCICGARLGYFISRGGIMIALVLAAIAGTGLHLMQTAPTSTEFAISGSIPLFGIR